MKSFTIEDIKIDPTFQDFVEDRIVSKSTLFAYYMRFASWCDYNQLSLTQLINEAEEEQDNGIKRKKRTIKKRFSGYINFLRDENKTPNTIKSYLGSVKAIYSDNDIDTPKIQLSSREVRRFTDIETFDIKEDIIKIAEIANPRDRSIILLQSSSGMGASEVRHLTVGDYINALKKYGNVHVSGIFRIPNLFEIERILAENEDLIGEWAVRRYKTGMPYYTFSSPESMRSIHKYLEYRTRQNCKIRNLDDYLFVTKNNTKIKITRFMGIYSDLDDVMGFQRRSNGFRHITSHIPRKFFMNTLLSNKVDKLKIDWMVGHIPISMDQSYFFANQKDLKEEYTKALPDLTLLEEIKMKVFESEDYKRLKELEEQEKIKDETIVKMQKQIENLYALYGSKEFTEKHISD